MYPLWVVFLLLPLYFVSLSVGSEENVIKYVKDKILTKDLVNNYTHFESNKVAWTTFERYLYILECYNITKIALLSRYYGVYQNDQVDLSYLFSLEVQHCSENVWKYIKLLSYDARKKEHSGVILSTLESYQEYTLTRTSHDFKPCDDSSWVKAEPNTWNSLESNRDIHPRWRNFTCKEPMEGNVIKVITITNKEKPRVDLSGYWITYQGDIYSLECYTITRNTFEAYLSRISISFDRNGEVQEFDILLKLQVKNCQSDVLKSIKVMPYKTNIGTHHGLFIDSTKCCWRYDKLFNEAIDFQCCVYFEENLWNITRNNYWKRITKQNQKEEIEKMYNHGRLCTQVKNPGNIIEIFTVNTTQLAEDKRGFLLRRWMNYQKSKNPSMYILECYERQRKPNVVYMFSYNGDKNETTRELIRTYILAMTVMECGSDMLDSIKVLPHINGIHSGMCIDVYQCCKKYTLKSGTETVFEDCTDYGGSNWINDMYSKWDIIGEREAERKFNEKSFNEDLCTMENPGEIIEASPPKLEEIKDDDPLITSTTLWTTVQGKVMYIIECSKKMDQGGHTFFALLGIYNGEKTEKGEPMVNYFLKMVVTFCNREVLNSMTVLPYDQHTGTHHGLYTDNKKCCTLYSKSVSETSLEFRPCTQYQKHTWRNIDWTDIEKDHIIEYYNSQTGLISGLDLTVGTRVAFSKNTKTT